MATGKKNRFSALNSNRISSNLLEQKRSQLQVINKTLFGCTAIALKYRSLLSPVISSPLQVMPAHILFIYTV